MKPEDIKFEVWPPRPKKGMLTGKIVAGVRLTHIPTGIKATCTTERSQHANRDKALRMLEASLARRGL